LERIANKEGTVTTGELRSLLFGDFLHPGADPQLYVELTSTTDLVRVVEEYLQDYNANSKAPMNLVLFIFAVEHVTRICRIIRQPGGHALLVGLGGSGRQSLTRLAAFMEEYKTCQVRCHRQFQSL
jgi:dynein heavy chain, axonemal